ncbi:MAG: nucleotidyltransferase [Pusillimonas sp.]|uniref:nucleotidyltransferase domain-containing protein n=1 Tax=Rhodanobacter sp. FW021-MT20 TaxID=1162282 RepID=UPI000260F8F0|nr:nucleotidyltransferase [Rhodanobacter sp. 115]EIL87438.1 hypothetical protein UU5_18777 [Rhodanobacter sp. 115]TAM00054.1 MAG: nucleotidyltransferase [Pusillimonas sp.]
MPRSIEQGFSDFLEKLKAKIPESQAATNHRASIEACLRSNFGLNRFVRIGSFGNGTSVSGYSDVDYLASIPANEVTASSSYFLTKVRNALDTRFPLTGVRIDTPAVVVPFGTYKSETTEVVPAGYVTQNTYKVYKIADGDGGWMNISPDAHNDYVSTIDTKLGGKVRPLIRFIKAWKFYRGVPISSFYLEMFTARYASTETSIVYSIDIKRVLRQLVDRELPNMYDPTGVGGTIKPCKTALSHADALSKTGTASTRAGKAYDAELRGDTKGAFDWWSLLYDGHFPTYYL